MRRILRHSWIIGAASTLFIQCSAEPDSAPRKASSTSAAAGDTKKTGGDNHPQEKTSDAVAKKASGDAERMEDPNSNKVAATTPETSPTTQDVSTNSGAVTTSQPTMTPTTPATNPTTPTTPTTQPPATATKGVSTTSDKTAVALIQNSTAFTTLTLTATGGFTGKVTVAVPAASLPAGVTAQVTNGDGSALTGGQVTVGATPVQVKVALTHAAAINAGVMQLSAPVAEKAVAISVTPEGGTDQPKNLGVSVAGAALINTVPPANNGGKLFVATEVMVPKGVGLCIVNLAKTSLRIHGNPHQPAGMPMSSCYDKYGAATLTMATASTVKTCATPASDTVYDHDLGQANGGGGLKVTCQP